MLHDGPETPLLVSHLQELDLELDELQQVIDAQNETALQALIELWEDPEELERLGPMAVKRRSEIDIFNVLGLDDSELFHSDFLGWLLDPEGSHGLGENFLRRFLRRSWAKTSLRAGRHASSTVRREREITLSGSTGRLDIFILNQSAKFLCAVENKVWSDEGENQLAFYREALEFHYPNYKRHLVFLTPGGDEPDSPEEREHWNRMSYTDILRMVERTTKEQSKSANADAAALLRQYAVTLRRNIVPEISNDAHTLARKIYRKHKQAIDLIIEHRERYEPNYPNEGFKMVREAVAERPEWKESKCNNPYARFISADWDKYLDILKVDPWPDLFLQFQVHATYRRATLSLFLHWKGNQNLRKGIYDRLGAIPAVFKGELPPFTESNTVGLVIGEILEESDYETWWNEEKTKETISRRLDEFAQGGFREINRAVLECLENYQAQEPRT